MSAMVAEGWKCAGTSQISNVVYRLYRLASHSYLSKDPTGNVYGMQDHPMYSSVVFLYNKVPILYGFVADRAYPNWAHNKDAWHTALLR